MKKRFLSIVLAVLMLVGIMPISAIAADAEPPAAQTAVGTVSTDGAIHVNKSVSADGKTLKLEAFATNTVSTETTYDPLDIVLVLDVSGSMRDCINCNATYDYYSSIFGGEWKWSNKDKHCLNQPEYVYERQGFAKDLGKNASPLYRASRGGYSMVEWCNGSHLFGNHQPGWYEDGLFSHSRVSDNTILYKRVKADRIEHQHRIEALKAAVGDFIDSVATQKDSEGNTIDNRISLVTFASDAKTVKGLTKASTGSGELKTAVSNLTADGATQANFGMEQAKLVLNGRTGEDKTRKSVVILFTDGTPTSGTEFESKVASGAIAAAKALKTGGTTVFTVGIFKGANPAADPGNDNTNKYMHAVSSNYPGATYKKSQGSYQWNFGERAKDSNYYLAASDANGLNAVFQAISNEVNTLAVKVDATSVLSDTLSGAFDFNAPENAEYSGITVAKYPVTGMENGVYTWGAAQELAIGEGEGKVQVEVAGKKLEVTGFDYGANAVTTKTEGDSTTYSGYKLVVTIPIKPDTEYHGWADGANYYDTNSTANGSKAGLEYGETGSRQKLELNDSPEAPVTGYTVSYEFKGTAPDSVTKPDDKVYIEGQNYTIETAPSKEGWTFKGWCSDEACTAIVSGQKPMGTEPVTYYGKWEQKQPDVLVTKRATYTRDGVDMGSLPYDTGNKNEMGTVQVDDVINYTVTITNTGTTTFGNADYALDRFTSPSGNPLLEHTSGTSQIKSGDKEQIKLAGLEPTKSVTKYYRYVVTENDATGTKRIANNVWAYVHIDPTDSHSETLPNRYSAVNVNVVKPEPKTATLRFEFKSGDDTITTLPQGVLNKKPADSDEVEVGTDVTLPSGFTEVTDTVNKGKWTFVGWYTDDNLSAESKITGDTYPMPEGGKTLYGKWTFEADEPADTTLTIAYYLMHADGTYPSEATDSATTDGKVGEDFTAEAMKTAYDDKGYKFDDSADNRIRGDLVLDPNGNVFKLYYKAVPKLEVTKTITDVTRDGEPLNPDNPEVEVKEGDVIEYEITVRNSGKLNLTDIVLTDEFTGAEGDLNIISGDDYTVDGYEITLKNDLNVGDSVTIKATYEVQLGDSGYEITNKASGTAKDALGGDVTGKSERVTIRPDALKAYRIFGSAYKYVKSEKGTFNKDGEIVPFEFKVTSDKKGEEILDTFTIDVSETVKAGETSEGDWGGFDFNLSEEEFENLDKKEFNGKEYPVVYLWELKGDLKNMSYSTKRITLYLDRPNISYYSAREPMVEYLGRWMAYADPDKGADADIINIYGKQSSSGGTVKVGPQLNRDDHVAYIMGYPDGTVQPEGQITRAEACTIFFRLLTDSSRDYYFSKTNDYTDVNAGDWFNNAISTLSNAGIVTGYNDGTFRPNQPITRGEMAKIIANFANLNKGTKSFTDLSGHWSKSYVELAAGNGWIAGYPDGSFRPDQKITRAETVTMINRVLERVPAKELRLLSRSIMLTFPDNNPGDWYYIAIQEASNSHEYQRSVYETTGDEMWTKLIDNVDWTKLEK